MSFADFVDSECQNLQDEWKHWHAHDRRLPHKSVAGQDLQTLPSSTLLSRLDHLQPGSKSSYRAIMAAHTFALWRSHKQMIRSPRHVVVHDQGRRFRAIEQVPAHDEKQMIVHCALNVAFRRNGIIHKCTIAFKPQWLLALLRIREQ